MNIGFGRVLAIAGLWHLYIFIYIYFPNQYIGGLEEAAQYGKPVSLHQKEPMDIQQPASPKRV